MTEKECPIEYGSEPTCNENAVCRDCQFQKGGCNWEEFRQRKLREGLIATRQVTK